MQALLSPTQMEKSPLFPSAEEKSCSSQLDLSAASGVVEDEAEGNRESGVEEEEEEEEENLRR